MFCARLRIPATSKGSQPALSILAPALDDMEKPQISGFQCVELDRRSDVVERAANA